MGRSGRIPQTFINDLLARVDIVDVIEARLTLKKSGSNRYLGLCPFHGEKTPSFNVNTERQFYYCFGCGATGTALKFLMEHDRLDFVSAVEALASIAGVEVPRDSTSRESTESNRRLFEALAAAETYYRTTLKSHPDAARAVTYLKGRGVSGLIARDFGIGYAPQGWDALIKALSAFKGDDLLAAGLVIARDSGGFYDRFRDRIMFPIRDLRGRVIGFGGRVLGDEQPKYLNSPETAIFHKGRELYGLYEARRALRTIERLILVEGYMDVVALAEAGITNAVATLGTASGAPHFEKLFRYTPQVVCCFDGDTAGREAAWKALSVALPALAAGHGLSFVFLPEGEDPIPWQRRAPGVRAARRRRHFGGRIPVSASGARSIWAVDGRARLPISPALRESGSRGFLTGVDGAPVGRADRLSPGYPGHPPAGPPRPCRPRSRRPVEVPPDHRSHRHGAGAAPACWRSWISPTRRAVAMEDSVLGRLVQYLVEHPEVDSAVLAIGRGGGYERLLPRRRPLISGAALRQNSRTGINGSPRGQRRTGKRCFRICAKRAPERSSRRSGGSRARPRSPFRPYR
jgi:DNA primase